MIHFSHSDLLLDLTVADSSLVLQTLRQLLLQNHRLLVGHRTHQRHNQFCWYQSLGFGVLKETHRSHQNQCRESHLELTYTARLLVHFPAAIQHAPAQYQCQPLRRPRY